MRFELPLPLDVMVEMAVSKEGKIVAEPSFEGKPVIRMGEIQRERGRSDWGWNGRGRGGSRGAWCTNYRILCQICSISDI